MIVNVFQVDFDAKYAKCLLNDLVLRSHSAKSRGDSLWKLSMRWVRRIVLQNSPHHHGALIKKPVFTTFLNEGANFGDECLEHFVVYKDAQKCTKIH